MTALVNVPRTPITVRIVAKGTATLWLLLSQSAVDFVVVKSGAVIILTMVGVAATLVLAARVGRQEGLVGNPA